MKILLCFLLYPCVALAGDPQHRHTITNFAFASSIDRPLRNTVWLSGIDVNSKSSGHFLNSSGSTIAVPSDVVGSAYDSGVTYNISKFYKKNNDRMRLISNFVLKSPNTIYTVGFDTGVAAEKIRIQKSMFLGIAHVSHLNRRSHLALSAGSWFWGGVRETPCYDSFDREYWCQNLQAWSDYKPRYPKNLSYVDIKYLFRF